MNPSRGDMTFPGHGDATMRQSTKLQYLKRSTNTPRAGDVFAMLPPDGKYLFGRVIESNVPRDRAPTPNSNFMYIYSERSGSEEPNMDRLTPENLLLPPLFTNKMGWTKGVFKTIRQSNVTPDDLLDQHCFWDAMRQYYIDLDQKRLSEPTSLCGSRGLKSFRMIDDHVSDALGIERAPEK